MAYRARIESIQMIGGKAPMALAIMWSLVAITWVFVILRLYTRIFIIQSVGPDDHTYWLSGVRVSSYGCQISSTNSTLPRY